MNQQDRSFLVTFVGIMTVLVLLAAAIFLISRGVSVVASGPMDTERQEATALDRIRPVAQVVVAEPMAEGVAAAPKSGEEVVTSVCASCHQAGVLQAPKIGAQEDWQPRLEKGLDTLVQNAVNGLNAMPPKGGNPNLSEEEIHNAVLHMLAQSGIEAGDAGQTAEAPAAAPAAAPAQAAGSMDLAKGKEVYNGVCLACHAAGVLQAPKVGDQPAWDARYQEKGFDTLVHNAINGLNAMPPKGGNPGLSDGDIQNAVAFMLAESGVEMAAAAPAQPAAEAPAAEEQAAEAPAAEEQAAEAPATEEQAAEAPATEEQTAEAPAQPAAEEQTAEAPAQPAAEPAQEAQQVVASEQPAEELTQEQAQAVEQAVQETQPQEQAQQEPAPEAPAPGQRSAELQAGSQVAMAGAVKEMPGTRLEIPEGVDMTRGKQLYNTACIICHQQGVAGAPKLGDKAAWSPRLEKGFDTLVHNAINGYKAMPPKGGSMDVPDEDIKAAVAFMAQESR